MSQRAQAVYAVRGALLCARLGAYRASWFFFADLPPSDTGVFSRSGLTTSVASGAVSKASYRALQGLVAVLGNSHFLGAVVEDDTLGWVHTYVLLRVQCVVWVVVWCWLRLVAVATMQPRH